MRSRTLSLVVAALVLSCSAPAGQARAGVEDTTQKHFFWKVTGPKGVVYLLGTIHVGKADFYPLPAVIEDSFKPADTLIEEVNLGEPANASQMKQWIVEHGGYPNGDTVANHLSEVTRSHLAAYFRDSGKSEAVIARMRPWLISMIVSQMELQRRGFDASKGIDRHFFEEAGQLRKPIGALETAESQLQLFSSLSEGLQDRLLLNSLVQYEKSAERLELLIHAWQAGDADAMQEAITHGVRDYPQLKPIMKKLFDDRNVAMAQQIEGFLQTPKTFFVAVGAGHLVGDQGILSQLRQKNFTVEQL